MADLGILQPDAYTNVASTTRTGVDPALEEIASADDADYVSDAVNSTHTGSCYFTLEDVPADFVAMTTVSVRLRYARSANNADKTWDNLRARVYKSDGTTALTDSATLASSITTTTPTNSSVIAFTGVDTAATKAEWNAARLYIYFDATRTKGGNTDAFRVYAGELTGTYSNTVTVTGTAAGAATSSGTASATVTVLATAAGAATSSGTSISRPGPGSLNALLNHVFYLGATSATVPGTAAGAATASGTASATVTLTGTAAGAGTSSGTASATVTVLATAAGAATSSGTASGTVTVLATAAGAATSSGTSSATVTVLATAAGAATSSGTASATVTVLATGAGTGTSSGTSSATVTVLGTAAGAATSSGTASATVLGTEAGIAAGAATSSGTAIGTVTTSEPAQQVGGYSGPDTMRYTRERILADDDELVLILAAV